MNNIELEAKTKSIIYKQIKQRNYATMVDTLIGLGYLDTNKLNLWKNEKIDYLERVCTTNLSKLSLILKTYTNYSKKENHYLSYTFYKTNKTHKKLRFTKTGNENLERLYSSHIILKQKEGN